MELSRRGFIKLTSAGLAASSLGALGFGFVADALGLTWYAGSRQPQTRNTCTYCSVACKHPAVYSLGDRARETQNPDIIHIEGDPDHPVNRGHAMSKGSALLDIMHPRRRD